MLTEAGLFGLRGPWDEIDLIPTHGIVIPGGWMRVRIGATGRGSYPDGVAELPTEHLGDLVAR